MEPTQPNTANQRQLPPLPKVNNQTSHPNLPLYNYQKPQIRASSSAQSFQSGSNLSLQSSASRLSLGGLSSNQSLQSMGSSESFISQQPSEPLLPTQTFPVIYNHARYMVDPALLFNSSLRFRELLQPFMQDNQISPDLELEVAGYDFSNRNMNNFLKLCQNLPTDVQNSEMKEICEIAKMFKAEKIYDTGLSFVQSNLDPNFNVPDDKYDGSNGKSYMFIECENHVIHHADLEDLEFDDFEDEDENENENKNDENKDNNKTNESVKDEKKTEETPKKVKSVIYLVRAENHSVKCPVFRFCLDGKILYTAKQKDNNIFIGQGNNVHINSDTSNHVGHIFQDSNSVNFIRLNDQQYKLKYVASGKPDHTSLSVTFPYKERQITWTPKTPKYNAIKNKYYLNFHGEYHHRPIRSRKNIVLQNPNGHTTFIVRKMADNVYELEALPLINPLVIFTIGLSDIVGPFFDPLA